jgi:hypothetical protein
MIKHSLYATIAAIALCAPLAAQAQTTLVQHAPATVQVDPATGNLVRTTVLMPGQPADGDDFGPGPAMVGPPIAVAPTMAPPRAVWIPGHYNWDQAQQNYVWAGGEFTQPPHPNAQWRPGHWSQQPSGWVWSDGHWN